MVAYSRMLIGAEHGDGVSTSYYITLVKMDRLTGYGAALGQLGDEVVVAYSRSLIRSRLRWCARLTNMVTPTGAWLVLSFIGNRSSGGGSGLCICDA